MGIDSYKVVFDEKDKTASQDKRVVLGYLRNSAVDFVYDLISELDLPTTPQVYIDVMRGFEDPGDVKTKTGSIDFNIHFQSAIGKKIRMQLSIPYARGMLLKPSVIDIDGNLEIFSENAINNYIKNFDTMRPIRIGDNIMHTPTINVGVYDVEDTANDRVDPYFDFYIQDPVRR